MYHIHGLSISSNTTKVIYVAEALSLTYEFTNLDFVKAEHKSPEHLARHPLGKAPTLTHDGRTLFESGAICRYLASVADTELFPAKDPFARACIDQWMMFFTCHVGRHFNTYAFELVAKKMFGLGEPNEAAAREALGFIEAQLPAVEAQLTKHKHIAGDALSIADHYAFAYSENAEVGGIALDRYPAFARWYANMKQLPAIQRGFKILGRS